MGEAKRRSLAAQLKDMHKEGQGVWDMRLYTAEGILDVLAEAESGDIYARGILVALEDMVQQIVTAVKPMMCLTCDNELTAGRVSVWVLTTAHRDDPKRAIGNGICKDCWRRHPDVRELGPMAAEVWRTKILSDMRVLPPASEAGRA